KPLARPFLLFSCANGNADLTLALAALDHKTFISEYAVIVADNSPAPISKYLPSFGAASIPTRVGPLRRYQPLPACRWGACAPDPQQHGFPSRTLPTAS